MICGTQPFEDDIRAIDWANNGKFISAATNKGKIYLINPKNLEILSEM